MEMGESESAASPGKTGRSSTVPHPERDAPFCFTCARRAQVVAETLRNMHSDEVALFGRPDRS